MRSICCLSVHLPVSVHLHTYSLLIFEAFEAYEVTLLSVYPL
jgi:hypothetical protein